MYQCNSILIHNGRAFCRQLHILLWIFILFLSHRTWNFVTWYLWWNFVTRDETLLIMIKLGKLWWNFVNHDETLIDQCMKLKYTRTRYFVCFRFSEVMKYYILFVKWNFSTAGLYSFVMWCNFVGGLIKYC